MTADLYFETGGTIGCIHNGRSPKEMTVTYGWNEAGRKMEYDYNQMSSPSLSVARDILWHFFYTVSTNYSTYAFNENDYRKDVVLETGRQRTKVKTNHVTNPNQGDRNFDTQYIPSKIVI